MEWTILKNLREGRGLSCEALAKLADLSGATIAKYENEFPRQVQSMLNLCIALDVTPSYITGFNVDEKSDVKKVVNDGNVDVRLQKFNERETRLIVEAVKHYINNKKDAVMNALNEENYDQAESMMEDLSLLRKLSTEL